jgi:dienelactone hydrolase
MMKQRHFPARGLLRGAAASLVLVAAACAAPVRLAPDDSDVVLARHTIDAPDPAAPGAYPVLQLYYGSGTDRNRAEYRDSVSIRTEPVDASKLVDLGTSARSRNRYWGFTPKEMPLNARVWHPDGPGPFPLVLVVHGNHDMKDFSDPGYEYLGRLLASRGYIFASVDMNFINGSIRGENDARGWFLLKHVEAFRRFGETEGNPFHGRVDTDRVVLIGHSRGGEAVGHAAAFNRLERYPDDGNVTFDFGFGIRGIIAIAPVDGQYRPADRLVPVRDVNYLVFHGSHDGDVTSFMGLRQYQRVTFTDSAPNFKAAVYVHRANHGQWNTVWGDGDWGPRSSRVLDLRPLLPAADQRRMAEVYISAFLEATLRDDARYLPLFRDHRVAGNWLPKTMYFTRYSDSSFRPVATFEEDVDLATGTLPGVTLAADSLGSWREAGLNLRYRSSPGEGSTLQNHAVWVGWNNRIQGEADSTRRATPAAFIVRLDDEARRALRLGGEASLQFELLPVDGAPPARKRASQEGDSAAAAPAARKRPAAGRRKDDEAKPPVELSIEVVDVHGVRAALPLERYGAVRRPLEVRVLRRRDRETAQFARLHETVLQGYSIPLADFVAIEPTLDAAALAQVRFLFDRTPEGTVIIDGIGFAGW